MKILIVEDDFVSRQIIHRMLSPHGECDIAANGNEALQAFWNAFENGDGYDLICLDIMMPELSGIDVLKKLRDIEEQQGIGGLDQVKVIMTTASSDKRHILGSFKEGCEAYITKPIDKADLIGKVRALGLPV